MSLSTELTGVQAAQSYIDTVGNNIANVDTNGFKLSNNDFAALYGGLAPATPGVGVTTQSLAQSFAQGQISQTGNPYDVAIDGSGFFQLKGSSGTLYSRDGSFQLNSSGYLSTASGAMVLGFSPGVSGGSLAPIQVTTGAVAGNATSMLDLNLNLPTSDAAINTTTTPFSTSNSTSYNESTSTTVYDSLGQSGSLTTYYTKVSGSGTPPQWQTHWALSDANGATITSGAGPTLTFNSSGQLQSGSGAIAVTSLPDGAAPLNIALSYTGSSLSDLAFGVNSATNNGEGSGQFTGVSIAANGEVTGQYSNGATKDFGTVALANFTNPQGLQPLTGNVWQATTAAGTPVVGAPGTAAFGQLQSGSLEGSNVDLTTQLVDLIVAQQAYQANVQSISVEQQNFQKLMAIQ